MWTRRYLNPAAIADRSRRRNIREQIPGKGYTERASHVSQRRHVLGVVFDMECVYHADERHDQKYIREDQAQAIHAAERKLLP
jgi:hypothetical protein